MIYTWVNDGVLLAKSNSGVPPFPLRPLDFQVALFNGQEGDALVVSCVELCQVLPSKEKCVQYGTINIRISLLKIT